MNRKMLNIFMAIIIETLDEVQGDCAESTIYLALGSDIHAYHDVKAILVGAGIVNVTQSNRVSLTAKGKALAGKIREAKAATA